MQPLQRKKTETGKEMEGPGGSLIPAPTPSPWACRTQRRPSRMAVDAMRACVPRFMETGPFHTTVLYALVHLMGFLLFEL